MRSHHVRLGILSLVATALTLVGGGALTAQDPLTEGSVLDRMEIPGSDGMEAILVLREVPPGGESGRHKMEVGSEIVYILDGSVVVEVEGMPKVTVEAGGTFRTTAGQVHNVKNASAEGAIKALAFYITKRGTAVEDLSVPVE